MTIDEIKKRYDSLCTPMESYLGAVEQVQARHVLASKAFPFLIEIAAQATHYAEQYPASLIHRAPKLLTAIRNLEEAKL